MSVVEAFIKHISEKPWGDYTQADYSIDQWHKACLIHQHDGTPTSKSQCKLPVRTPDGKLNRNGLYAAAAVLDGARAGLSATSEEKAKAKQTLLGYYKQMKQTPPHALFKQSSISDEVEKVLSHVGVKGMHWGVRRRANRVSVDRKAIEPALAKSKTHGPKSLTNRELNKLNHRLQLEKKFTDLSPKQNNVINKGHNHVKAILAIGATINTAYAFSKSPAGKAVSEMLDRSPAGIHFKK